MKANNVDIGRVNEKILGDVDLDEMRRILEKFGDRLFLPIDVAIDINGRRKEIDAKDLPTPYPIRDIGEKTVNEFKKEIKRASTIFLSGPPGVFEKEEFSNGTKDLFEAVAESGAYSIIGGGHTVAAMNKFGMAGKVSYASTGGGALERFMMGERLPAVEALKKSKFVE
jgi:phosphoglycerate kinase